MGIAVVLSLCILSCMCYGVCYADDDDQYVKTIFQRLKHIIGVWGSPHTPDKASGKSRENPQSNTSTRLKTGKENSGGRTTNTSIGGDQSIVTNSSKAENIKTHASRGESANKTDKTTGKSSKEQTSSVQTENLRKESSSTAPESATANKLNNSVNKTKISSMSKATKHVEKETTSTNQTISQSSFLVNRIAKEQRLSVDMGLKAKNTNTQLTKMQIETMNNNVTPSIPIQSGKEKSPDKQALPSSQKDKKSSVDKLNLPPTKKSNAQNITVKRNLKQDKKNRTETINTVTSQVILPDFTELKVDKNNKADIVPMNKDKTHEKSVKEGITMETSQTVSSNIPTGIKKGDGLSINNKDTKERLTTSASQTVSSILNNGNVNQNTKSNSVSIHKKIETQKPNGFNQFTIDNQIFRVKIPREQLPHGQIAGRHMTNSVIPKNHKTERSQVLVSKKESQNLIKNNLPPDASGISVQATPASNKFSNNRNVKNTATFTLNSQRGSASPSPDYSTLHSTNNINKGIVFPVSKKGKAPVVSKQINKKQFSKISKSPNLSGQVRSSGTRGQIGTRYDKGSIISPSLQPDQVILHNEKGSIISPSKQPDQVLQGSVKSVSKISAPVREGNSKVNNVVADTSGYVVGGNSAIPNSQQDIVRQNTAQSNENFKMSSVQSTGTFSQNRKQQISQSTQGNLVKNRKPNKKSAGHTGQLVNNNVISKAGRVGTMKLKSNSILINIPPESPTGKGFVSDASLEKMIAGALKSKTDVTNGIRNVFTIKTHANASNQSNSNEIKSKIASQNTIKFEAARNTTINKNKKTQSFNQVPKKVTGSSVPLASSTKSNKGKTKAAGTRNQKSGMVVVPNDPQSSKTGGFVKDSSTEPFKNFGKTQIKTPPKSMMVSITPTQTYELKIKKKNTQGLMTSKVTFRAGHNAGKRSNVLTKVNANDIVTKPTKTVNNVSSKPPTTSNSQPTQQKSATTGQTQGRKNDRSTAGKIQTFTLNKKQNQKGHFSFKSLPQSTRELVVPAPQKNIITKAPKGQTLKTSSSSIAKGNIIPNSNFGLGQTKTTSSMKTKMTPDNNGVKENNHQTDMTGHTPSASSDVIIKIRVQSATDPKPTGETTGTAASTSHLVDVTKQTLESGMLQSITNFGNNRLLYNEFRKYKLLGKIRKKRSVLSVPMYMNNIIDKPVKVFSNSYDTIIGDRKNSNVGSGFKDMNNAMIGKNLGSQNSAMLRTGLGYLNKASIETVLGNMNNARIGTDLMKTNTEKFVTGDIDNVRAGSDLAKSNNARRKIDLNIDNAKTENEKTNNTRIEVNLVNSKTVTSKGNINSTGIGTRNTKNTTIRSENTNRMVTRTEHINNVTPATGKTKKARFGTAKTNTVSPGTENRNNFRPETERRNVRVITENTNKTINTNRIKIGTEKANKAIVVTTRETKNPKIVTASHGTGNINKIKIGTGNIFKARLVPGYKNKIGAGHLKTTRLWTGNTKSTRIGTGNRKTTILNVGTGNRKTTILNLGTGNTDNVKLVNGNRKTTGFGSRNINKAKLVNGNIKTTGLGTRNVNKSKLGNGNIKTSRLATGNANKARLSTGNTNKARLVTGNTNKARLVTGNTNNQGWFKAEHKSKLRIGNENTNGQRIRTTNTNNARLVTGKTQNKRVISGKTTTVRLGNGNTVYGRITNDVPSLDKSVLTKDNSDKVKLGGSNVAIKYNNKFKSRSRKASRRSRRKRNYKSRHISDSLFHRIRKTLSKGLTVFSKKSKTSLSPKKNKPSLGSSVDKKPGNINKALRINFHTLKQSKNEIKHSNKPSSNYHGKKDTNRQLDKSADFQTLLLHGNKKDLNSHYRQHFVQVDSVLHEPTINMLSQPPSIKDKHSDFTSSHVVHVTKKPDHNRQSQIEPQHSALSNVQDKPAHGLSMGGIYISNSNPLPVVESKLLKDMSTKGRHNTNERLISEPSRNVKYTHQRHHDSIINMPNLLSGLSNINDIVSVSSFPDDISSTRVGGQINTPMVKASVTKSPSVNDVVTAQFEKLAPSEIPHAITLSDIKIVPGGCIIDGKFHRYEDLPKFVQDYYDTKTQKEVKLPVSGIEPVLNDYTDNKGSISQGFGKDYPVLEVMKGQESRPFSIQLPGDSNGYDILIDPHLHEGSLELAVLHANHMKRHGNKFDIGGQDSFNDMHINHPDDQSQKTSLKWSDGIFDKAGTGLASLSDYHLGSEVRVGSSLSLGQSQIVGNGRDSTGFNLAMDHTRGSEYLSLPLSSNMKGPGYAYFNPVPPKLGVNGKSKIEPLSTKSLIDSSVMADMIVSSDDKPIGMFSQHLNPNQQDNKLNIGGTFGNDVTPSQYDTKNKMAVKEINSNIDVVDGMNNNGKLKLNHYKGHDQGTKAIKHSKYDMYGTSVPSIDSLIPSDYQLKDSFSSNFKLGEVLSKDVSGFNLGPKSESFGGLKMDNTRSIPVRLSGQYDLDTVMNSILTSPKHRNRGQILDIFGK